MSNIFKSAIYKPTSTVNTTVYSCNATARAVIQNIQLTNQAGGHTVGAYVFSSSNATTVQISNTSISANSMVNLALGPIILQEGDALLLSTDSTVVAGIVSIMEINRGLIS